MRVLIADDHAIVRDGLSLLLDDGTDHEFEVVAEAATGAEVLDQIGAASPDIVLLDLRMPGMSGFDVLEAMQGLVDRPRVVVLTMHDDLAFVRRAIELGADGYLLKSVGREELRQALRSVQAGRPFIQGDLTRPLVASLASDGGDTVRVDLSPRQRRVLDELARGRDNSEIAENLAISKSTVKAELRALYRALGVTRRSEAVAVAFRLGILS